MSVWRCPYGWIYVCSTVIAIDFIHLKGITEYHVAKKSHNGRTRIIPICEMYSNCSEPEVPTVHSFMNSGAQPYILYCSPCQFDELSTKYHNGKHKPWAFLCFKSYLQTLCCTVLSCACIYKLLIQYLFNQSINQSTKPSGSYVRYIQMSQVACFYFCIYK